MNRRVPHHHIDKNPGVFHDLADMTEEVAAFKSYLQSLSSRELFRLADEAGIDLPLNLERVFIIRELMDSALEDEPEKELTETSNLKTAPLPKQYHISFLETLPRDPRWVYVFWEIKAQDREQYEKMPLFTGYALRVLECGGSVPKEAFTVPVDAGDSSRYLGFPPGGGSFRVSLWARGLELSLLLSRPFELPRFLNDGDEFLSRPLVRLSGAADFNILRDADRISRRR